MITSLESLAGLIVLERYDRMRSIAEQIVNAREENFTESMWNQFMANAGANCGVGSGGFQPGNKCAKGGTGSSDKPAKTGRKRKVDKDKVARAKAAHVMIKKKDQDYGHNVEKRVAKNLLHGKAKTFDDSEPADVVCGAGGKHRCEVKAVIKGKNAKITMDRYAKIRKVLDEKKSKGVAHTIVIDARNGYKNGRSPEDTPIKIYYRRGAAGSARLSAMHKVKNKDELNKLMRMDDKELPKGAKRTDARERKGKRWKPTRDPKTGRKAYVDVNTGEMVIAKK